jgi:hypothetical protein
VAVITTEGAIILDSLAVLLFGTNAIRLRSGKYTSMNSTGTVDFLTTVLSTSSDEIGLVQRWGAVILVTSSIFLFPFSWENTAMIILAAFAIGLFSNLLLELAYRSRMMGNLAVIVLFILGFWSIHICASSTAQELTGVESNYLWKSSWTEIFTNWWISSLIGLGVLIGWFILIRLWPSKNESLTNPRFWLFA